MRKEWSFRQRFSVRAGTMLLLFCLGLAGLALVDPLYEALVAVLPLDGDLFWRFGVNFERYLLIGAAFSLFFLGRSIVRREPQVQFLIEIVIAALLYLYL